MCVRVSAAMYMQGAIRLQELLIENTLFKVLTKYARPCLLLDKQVKGTAIASFQDW